MFRRIGPCGPQGRSTRNVADGESMQVRSVELAHFVAVPVAARNDDGPSSK